MVIKCNSCGANVNLENANSGTCKYCGNIQYKPVKSSSTIKRSSILTSKPVITQPRFYQPKSQPIDSSSSWSEMAASYAMPTEVQVGHYSLSVRNKNISDLDEIFNWFSDNELDQIEELDVSGNKLVNIDKAFKLKSLETLIASNNQISTINPDFDEESHFIKIDLSNNQLSSYAGLSDLKIDDLFLNNNKISRYFNLNYTGYIDLSGNLIDTVSGVETIRGLYPLFKLHTVVLLNDNPIKDIENIKSLRINILPINDYKSLDSNNYFKQISDGLKTSSILTQSHLQALFKYINERCIHVYLGNVKLNGVNTILGKDLPEELQSEGLDDEEFININTNKKYEWAEFIQYFGLKIQKEKKSLSINQIAIIVTIAIFVIIYILSQVVKNSGH